MNVKTAKSPKKLKKGSIVDGECYQSWPLRYRVTGLKPRQLVKRAESAIAELRSQIECGDEAAVREFERMLTALGAEYHSLLQKRAKAGDKSFHGSSSIDELLCLADETISCLAWLAKNRSADCARHAERRLNWPAYISVLADVESKSQAIKACIPLGRKFQHFSYKKTKADMLFRCARFVINYFSEQPSLDCNAAFYFYPFINGVEWMVRDEAHKAIHEYCEGLGSPTKRNWPKWKPVFARMITLQYGPSGERWKLIPDTINPHNWHQTTSRNGKHPKLIPKSWREYLDIAERFGTTSEWYNEYGKQLPLSQTERTELLAELKIMAQRCRKPSLMDLPPDASLARLKKRAKARNAKWGDYKNEILRRCLHLLPNG